MPNYNKIILVGHVAREIEMKAVGESRIGKFSIATNRNYQKNGEWVSVPMFIDVDCFGKTAERAMEQARKGAALLVEGELVMDTWEDRDSGKKRTKHLVRADRIVAMSKRGETDGDAPSRRNSSVDEVEKLAATVGDYDAPF